MSTGVVDVEALVKESMKKLTAMGGDDIPDAAGLARAHGAVTNDMAALLQATSAAGVPQVQLPSTSFDKPPTTPGM